MPASRVFYPLSLERQVVGGISTFIAGGKGGQLARGGGRGYI